VNLSTEADGDFTRAIGLLDDSEEILVLGIGASSAIAQDAAHQLRTIGLRAHAPIDPFAQIFEAGRLRTRGACLIVSHTGATVDMIQCAKAAREAGAAVVAISSYRTTPLQAEVDVVLVAGGVGTTFRPEAATNRVAHLLLVDALVNALTLRHPDRSADALDYLQAVTATNQI
jgi:DNA-binding MurR/RpiR family transcriptional regulator